MQLSIEPQAALTKIQALKDLAFTRHFKTDRAQREVLRALEPAVLTELAVYLQSEIDTQADALSGVTR